MPQVALLARFTAKDGKGDEVVAAFEPIIDQVRDEPGTLLYVMNRAKDDPDVFWFAELYADEDAFAAHGASDAMAQAMPVLGPLIAEDELALGDASPDDRHPRLPPAARPPPPRPGRPATRQPARP